MDSDRGSDFITNFAFVPPSPPQLDSVFDYPVFDSTSPPLPPSYSGSYYSPYSQHSELSFSGEDIQLQDFPVPVNEYEPSDYDAPNQPVSLLMFTNDSDYMSPHFSPNNTSFDHSSPSSNTSGVDENIQLDESAHSRASSVASNHPSPASPQPTFYPSPRLSVDFGNMSVHTPNWVNAPLPQHSPVHKAQSPPRLLMPDDQQQNVPVINAPPGEDDMMDGPQLRIVPATPISGGGAGRTNVPFQTTLSTLTQGSESNDHQQSSQQQRDPSPSRFPSAEDNSAVPSSSQPTTNNGDFIFPNDYSQQQQQQQQQRPRTHSDPWNPNFVNVAGGYGQQLQTFTFGGSNNENTFLSPDSLRRSVSDSQRRHRHSRSEDVRSPPMPYSGPGYHHHQQSHSIGSTAAASTTFLFPPNADFHTGQQQQQQQFLHPSQVPNLLNSSSTTPPIPHQQPHSLTLLSAASSASNPNLTNNSSGIGHFRRASSGTRSDRGAEVWGSLGTQGHHGMTPRRMSPYPSPNASPRVRYTTDLELDTDLTLGGGGGDNNNGTMGLGDLGEPPASAGFTEEIPLSRRGSYAGLELAIASAGGSQKAESIISGRSQSPRSNVPSASQTDVLPPQIPKVNVTTGRTANASHRRRKQDANFACTVPGCGSTFTRGFNLKGHLRSHFELKPYKCHWPGCGKGFARQHDCKRHEQLHSNFRPFECEGCMKQFARMDALNRHLKSDAGVECARIVGREKGGLVDEGMMERGGGGGNGYNMGGMAMISMKSEERKHLIPKRRQSGGGGGGGGPDSSWSGVAL